MIHYIMNNESQTNNRNNQTILIISSNSIKMEAIWYNDQSIVVRSNTKPIKEELMVIKGKWCPYLKGGKGWIFSGKRKKQIEETLGIQVQEKVE